MSENPPFPIKIAPFLMTCTATPNDDFKASPTSLLLQTHKYDKYDKEPYIVSSYYYYLKANLKAVLIYTFQTKLTLAPLTQQINKDILKCTLAKSLTTVSQETHI